MLVLVLQHVDCEHPGLITRLLRDRAIRTEIVRLYLGDELPVVENSYDVVLAFGGPMNVDEHDSFPWLRDEVCFIERVVRSGTPFLGVCLGAQLLARALGAAVYPAAIPEVGLSTVRLTAEAKSDPIFRRLSDPMACFQWHGDTFDLPEDSVLLATSADCQNQAFRWKDAAYGIQFHVEVTPDMAREWGNIGEYRAAAERVRGANGANEIEIELRERGRNLEPVCEALVRGFFALAKERV